MRMVKKVMIVSFVMTLLVCACGGGGIETNLPPGGSGSLLPPSFPLASDFPADIVIPDVDGMRNTAFIVSTSTPAGVLAVDLDSSPSALSEDFGQLVSPSNSGIPSKLFIENENLAFMLTSSSVVCFNPKTAGVLSVTGVTNTMNIGEGLQNSDGSTADSLIRPTFPGGIAYLGSRLFVSTANYIATTAPALAAPGTVQVFSVNPDCELSLEKIIVTSGYNPTGIAIRNGVELIVTNSGVMSIVDAKAVPETDSSVEVLDSVSLETIASISIGAVAANFQPLELTKDGARGFLGSASRGEVYELDLINRQVLRGPNNPIVVTSDGDMITDVALSVDDSFLFAASFEQSAVYPFDLTKDYEKGDPFIVGFPAGVSEENPTGANSGAGPMAVRPGTRGTDYIGADLFVLTGFPGTMVPVKTNALAVEYFLPEDDGGEEPPEPSPSPPPPPEGDEGEPCNGFAEEVFSVSYGEGAGFGQAKMPNVVLGPPQGKGSGAGGLDVVSLGRHGEIVLDLGKCAAVDGEGADFIVFENAFYIGENAEAPYAELGVVSVSEDGVTFVEFVCSSHAYPYDGCAGWSPVYSNATNGVDPFDQAVAGGDAFDLADAGLNKARYIMIRDLSGSGGGGGVGFDLDAVAVLNGEIQN